MACPFFLGDETHACQCGAVTGIVIPTLHQRRLHCVPPDSYFNCPTLLSAIQEGRRLTEPEYEDLWFAPAAASLPHLRPH